MGTSTRSFPHLGVTAVTVAAVVLTPAATPPTSPLVRPAAITLTAAAAPDIAGTALSGPIGDFFDSIAGALQWVGDGIESLYTTVEPWVQYGFEVAEYVVRWIPFVGWFAPQIMYFYDFGEAIVHTLVFNTIDVLDFKEPFFTAVSNVATDIWHAFTTLIDNEINNFLPPLPPWPLSAEADLVSVLPNLGETPDFGGELGGLPEFDGLAVLSSDVAGSL